MNKMDVVYKKWEVCSFGFISCGNYRGGVLNDI